MKELSHYPERVVAGLGSLNYGGKKVKCFFVDEFLLIK